MGGKEFSMDDIEPHNTADDFWTVIHGAVYDMSGYVSSHPGGKMILLAAGTDCTVMFEHYHIYDLVGVDTVLKRRKIGVSSCKSPDMGGFYTEARNRVIEKLREQPKRPKRAVVFFLLDVFVRCVLLLKSICLVTDSPQWQRAVMCLALKVSFWRVMGQAHALGHVQIFPARSMVLWQRVMESIGIMGEGFAILESVTENPRKKLNSPSEVANHEYSHRGPSLHQSIHHVRSAYAEPDLDSFVVSNGHDYRISGFQPFRVRHRFQSNMLYIAFSKIKADMLGWIPYIVIHTSYCCTRARKRAWFELCVNIVGLVATVIAVRARMLLLLSGFGGFFCFVWSNILFDMLMPVSWSEVLYSHHIWERTVDEHTMNKDWGRHMAETSRSFRGINWTLGCLGGVDPATHQYHLEHSLFPHLNYLHLPTIAHIVEATCIEFGIEYNKMEGLTALRRRWHADLQKFAVPPKEC